MSVDTIVAALAEPRLSRLVAIAEATSSYDTIGPQAAREILAEVAAREEKQFALGKRSVEFNRLEADDFAQIKWWKLDDIARDLPRGVAFSQFNEMVTLLRTAARHAGVDEALLNDEPVEVEVAVKMDDSIYGYLKIRPSQLDDDSFWEKATAGDVQAHQSDEQSVLYALASTNLTVDIEPTEAG